MENMTADMSLLRTGPLHVVTATANRVPATDVIDLGVSSVSVAGGHSGTGPRNVAVTANLSTITAAAAGTAAAMRSKPRLTLAAFRRPERTVRLTQSNASRLLESEYDLRSTGCGILGHGSFSTVRLARRRHDNLRVAVKSIAKHDALRARRLRRGGRSHLDEWEILQRFSGHPYIIKILDCFETDEEVHLVTEFCEGGELFDAIQKKRMRSPAVRRGHYSEEQAACITRQILTALRDLHAMGIAHRDVKPENIVLCSDDDTNIHAKLCDFGMARCFATTNATSATAADGGPISDTETPPSTPGRKHSFCAVTCDYYAAPEVCAAGASHKPPADMYSLGVTLYILLCGFPPMFSDDVVSAEEDGSDVLFPEIQWSAISESARQLIRRMLHPDPTKRITADNAIKNDWVCRNAIAGTASTMPARLKSTGSLIQHPADVTNHSGAMPMLHSVPNGEELAEHIRSRLYQALSQLKEGPPNSRSAKRRGSDAIVSPRRKQRRASMEVLRRRDSMGCQPRRGQKQGRRASTMECQRRSSIVCAMKELYRDMSSVSASASGAAEGVVCSDEKNDVHILNSDSCCKDPEGEKKKSPSTYKPRVTLSV